MKRFFVSADNVKGNYIYIDGIEHNHLKNVMRLKEDDEIIVVTGDQYDYIAKIVAISKGDTKAEIISKEINQYNPINKVTVFQALTKSDNMVLIVQKLTELGITTFYPFMSEYITSKDKMGKVDKLQVVSNQSVKQCKRSIPMKIENVLKFNEMCDKLKEFDTIVFANECEDTISLSQVLSGNMGRVAIIVGSEGGFSKNEINLLKQAGASSVTLGKRILRAETASIALASIVMYSLGEWNR